MVGVGGGDVSVDGGVHCGVVVAEATAGVHVGTG
jgi:hypothetical protein